MEYLCAVDNEKLIKFLNENGLFVLDDLTEVSKNECNENLYLRCASNSEIISETYKEIISHLSEKFPIIGDTTDKYMNSNLHLISINDFIIQRLTIIDELTNNACFFDVVIQ